MSTTPPGSLGFPFLGEALPLFSDPLAFFARRHQQYGPVFKTRLFGKPSVVVFGAPAQRLILLAHGDEPLYPAREAYRFLEPFFGTGLIQMDGLLHQTQRKLITPAFQGHNAAAYLIRINRAYDAIVGQWPDQGTRTFAQQARDIAFRVSTSLILGVEEPAAFANLSQLFLTLFEGTLALIPLDLPFTKYGKAMAVKSLIDEHLLAAIAQHREKPTTDVLSLLLQARDEAGQPLSDDQLLAHLKLVLYAGYETTAAVLSWGVLELLRHPDLYERLHAEVKAERVGGEEPVTLEDLRTTPFLDAFLKETLRLHSPGSFILRGLARACELEGYTIPADWLVILPLGYTHRMPEYFADPERFDPERFLPPREEDKKTPYAWMGFGGGKHMCLGMGIAQIEFKTVLSRLVRQFDLQLVANQDFSPRYIPVKHPKGGVKLAFHRRVASQSEEPASRPEDGAVL